MDAMIFFRKIHMGACLPSRKAGTPFFASANSRGVLPAAFRARASSTLLAMWLVSGIAVWGQAAAPPTAAPAPAAASPAAAGAAQFAGSETCGACHEDIFKAFAKNPHEAVETSGRLGFKGQACESCHGPGEHHAETADASFIRNPAKLAPAAVDKLCLNCHLNTPTHVGRIQNSHARSQLPCTTCHQIHAATQAGLVARKFTDVNKLCAGCHANVWAQFQKPNHHKLPEGAMSCVDCHDPHGSLRPAMTQSFGANEPGCLKCHGDKRGPFTFEHAPMRLEGCSACHEPHGSANPRMLTRQDVRFLCLECHANLPTVTLNAPIGVVPPAFHDLRSPRYQNCTVCHQKIHGSHVDRDLLK
jgi:DmsE family decaheme c-type cytochrome